jgi:hypothetical protein
MPGAIANLGMVTIKQSDLFDAGGARFGAAPRPCPRGVRDFMRNERNHFVTLPHAAVLAVFRKQMQEHQTWLQETGGRRGSAWKRGDTVRVDADGGAYAGLIATVDKIDSRGRIEVLPGMIRHTLPADMVVAA